MGLGILSEKKQGKLMSDFDRSAEDVGNVLMLEHLNLTVPDQGIAAPTDYP